MSKIIFFSYVDYGQRVLSKCERINMSVQLSSQDTEPPLKKQKTGYPSTELETKELGNNDLFELSQSLISSSPELDSNAHSIIIRKGDKMNVKISYALKKISDDGKILLVSSGDGIQKLLSIIEILKSKLKEVKDIKYEQFNKLDKYETFIAKNDILEKKRKVPVFYTLLRKIENNRKSIAKHWTRQEI